MRTLVTLVSAFALVGSAFAADVALTGTATTNGFISPTYSASMAIDGNTSTLWVAPGGSAGTANAYLLVNLGSVYTNVSNVQVEGTGTPGYLSAFDIFVGGAGSTVASLEAGTPIMIELNQADGPTLWTDTSSVTTLGSSIQYVLYEAIPDTANSSAPCASTGLCPGVNGQDDAFTNELVVNTTTGAAAPEPTTMGLISLSLIALGFVRRPRK